MNSSVNAFVSWKERLKCQWLTGKMPVSGLQTKESGFTMPVFKGSWKTEPMFLRFMKKTNFRASHRKNSNVWLHEQESNHVVTTTDRLSCEACTKRFLLAQTLFNLLCVLLRVCINSMVRFMWCLFLFFHFFLDL